MRVKSRVSTPVPCPSHRTGNNNTPRPARGLTSFLLCPNKISPPPILATFLAASSASPPSDCARFLRLCAGDAVGTGIRLVDGRFSFTPEADDGIAPIDARGREGLKAGRGSSIVGSINKGKRGRRGRWRGRWRVGRGGCRVVLLSGERSLAPGAGVSVCPSPPAADRRAARSPDPSARVGQSGQPHAPARVRTNHPLPTWLTPPPTKPPRADALHSTQLSGSIHYATRSLQRRGWRA